MRQSGGHSGVMSPPDPMLLFDRHLLRQRRDAAARDFAQADFLVREASAALADRLADVNRSFPVALDLGCHGGELAARIHGSRGIETTVCCDLSAAFAALASSRERPALVADEERLPFADASFDLVMSALNLHWVNDLPGALIQIRRILKPDGLFLASLFGGETLTELRQAWLAAEAEIEGGAGPRVSPFADLRDAAGLLQRAGFALPVADIDTITVTYADAFALMRELRKMGEANTLAGRRRSPTRRETLFRAAEIYAERFAEPDGRIRATFQMIHLTGWAPHESQQQPLRPGSARTRLADALDTVERPAGDTTQPN